MSKECIQLVSEKACVEEPNTTTLFNHVLEYLDTHGEYMMPDRYLSSASIAEMMGNGEMLKSNS